MNKKLIKQLQVDIKNIKERGFDAKRVFLVLNEDIFKRKKFEFRGISIIYKKGINRQYYFCEV